MFDGLRLTKSVDSFSPLLFRACLVGERLPDAMLTHENPGGGTKLTITFTDLLITSFREAGEAVEEAVAEEVAFSFGKIKLEYQRLGPTGEPVGVVRRGWDLRANKEWT